MSRYTMDVGEDIERLLEELATSTHTTKSEVIRRSLATYAYLRKATGQQGHKISITTDSDKVIKDVILL